MKLSKQQLEIVNSNDKNIIVDAGSGSGKTRTLTERVRRLLSEGVDPRSIVVITFTNMAADELVSRLSDIPNANQCFIGTIHSYANKLLKKSGYKFEIFSEYYQTQFMQALIPRYAKYCTVDDYLEFVKYDRKVAAGRMQEFEIKNKFSSQSVYNEIMQLLGRQYSTLKETVLTLCKVNNIISFDELIKLATAYFKESKTHLQYLFVDELQDIGYLEYNFLLRLNADNNFFIGDDYQAIFSFKGGDVNIFLSLMKNPDWKAYYLTENYRTAKTILMYANTVVSKASDIIKKDVVYMNQNKGDLSFMTKSQLDKFLSEVNEHADWFILTRSNKEMVMIDTALTKLNKKHSCFKQSNTSNAKMKEIMSQPCIKVMTIHSSKGLEADNVALYGKLPVKGTGDSEELKVFYVGITRSRDKCVIFV